MHKLLSLTIALVLLGGGIFAWQYTSTGQESAFVGMAEAQQESDEEIDTSIVEEMTLGDPDAPLTVVEYASFTCPHCKSFHENAFKEFKTAYIDTGKVHFVYREVYFDRFGLWAGMVARCGGADRYFGISDMIYAQQRDWTRGESPDEIAQNLMTIGRTAGLTTEELNACLQDGDKARAMIAVYQENADADGVRSTPTFKIGDQIVTGDRTFSDLSSLVEAELGS